MEIRRVHSNRFGWFFDSYVGWQRSAAMRLDDIIERYGVSENTERYIARRIRHAPFLSFEKRRWLYIRKIYRELKPGLTD